MIEALYVPDGDGFIPTEHTRGPWDVRYQHAGPPAALLARALEALPAESPSMLARLTVELLRPVPLTRLGVTASVERAGKRVQLLSATITDSAGEVCRASACRMRITELDLDGSEPGPLPFAAAEDAVPYQQESGEPAFHRTGVEMRFARGAFTSLGAATAWIRLRLPVVPGEAPSPMMRAMAAADFGNGISAVIPWGRYLFINTDLTVYLHREPRGEWVCLDARTDIGRMGVGLAQSELYDASGPVGRSLQALFVDTLTGESPAF